MSSESKASADVIWDVAEKQSLKMDELKTRLLDNKPVQVAQLTNEKDLDIASRITSLLHLTVAPVAQISRRIMLLQMMEVLYNGHEYKEEDTILTSQLSVQMETISRMLTAFSGAASLGTAVNSLATSLRDDRIGIAMESATRALHDKDLCILSEESEDIWTIIVFRLRVNTVSSKKVFGVTWVKAKSEIDVGLWRVQIKKAYFVDNSIVKEMLTRLDHCKAKQSHDKLLVYCLEAAADIRKAVIKASSPPTSPSPESSLRPGSSSSASA
jgi:hypothetical protein